MSDRRAVGVMFDGSFEGLLSIVHAYYYDGLLPLEIVEESSFQPSFGLEYVPIPAAPEKAAQVIDGIHKKLTAATAQYIFSAFLHADSDKYFTIFQYIIAGFHYRHTLDQYEQIDYVLRVHKLAQRVNGEAHLLKGFTRFVKTADNIFYADISPNHNVLPILAEHFAERLGGERWIIHDVKRGTAVVYDTQSWQLTDAPAQAANLQVTSNDNFSDLWSAFHEAIMIRERKNPRQQRSMMPKYFWKHMTEHKAVLARYQAQLGAPPAQDYLTGAETRLSNPSVKST